MTDAVLSHSMEDAVERIKHLPKDEQDRLAEWILAEIEADKRWDALFAQSGDLLDKMADEALAEHRAGKTKPLNLDDL